MKTHINIAIEKAEASRTNDIYIDSIYLILLLEFRKVWQAEAPSHQIHARPTKWIGAMFFEDTLSGHFHAWRNSDENWFNWI